MREGFDLPAQEHKELSPERQLEILNEVLEDLVEEPGSPINEKIQSARENQLQRIAELKKRYPQLNQ